MKIGISRNSLDCSGYWLVALVADDSHVGSPRSGRARTDGAVVEQCYHFSCHTWNRDICELKVQVEGVE